MPENPYEPSQVDSTPFPISAASKLRRRLFALVLIAAGVLLFFLRAYRPVSATILSPGFLAWGVVSLLFPVAVPDPKREYGMMQLWIDSSRRGFWLGPAALVLGCIAGVVWLLVG